MESEVAATLKEIADLLRVKGEDERKFREDLLEELRLLNRTLERLYDKEIGGPI